MSARRIGGAVTESRSSGSADEPPRKMAVDVALGRTVPKDRGRVGRGGYFRVQPAVESQQDRLHGHRDGVLERAKAVAGVGEVVAPERDGLERRWGFVDDEQPTRAGEAIESPEHRVGSHRHAGVLGPLHAVARAADVAVRTVVAEDPLDRLSTVH